jgi:hypothetical protein
MQRFVSAMQMVRVESCAIKYYIKITPNIYIYKIMSVNYHILNPVNRIYWVYLVIKIKLILLASLSLQVDLTNLGDIR